MVIGNASLVRFKVPMPIGRDKVPPVKPVAPTKPVAPVAPVHPVTPDPPVATVHLVAPVDPVAPVLPVTPDAPVAPVAPVIPVDPDEAAELFVDTLNLRKSCSTISFSLIRTAYLVTLCAHHTCSVSPNVTCTKSLHPSLKKKLMKVSTTPAAPGEMFRASDRLFLMS